MTSCFVRLRFLLKLAGGIIFVDRFELKPASRAERFASGEATQIVEFVADRAKRLTRRVRGGGFRFLIRGIEFIGRARAVGVLGNGHANGVGGSASGELRAGGRRERTAEQQSGEEGGRHA